jgi:hypothetical protein
MRNSPSICPHGVDNKSFVIHLILGEPGAAARDEVEAARIVSVEYPLERHACNRIDGRLLNHEADGFSIFCVYIYVVSSLKFAQA